MNQGLSEKPSRFTQKLKLCKNIIKVKLWLLPGIQRRLALFHNQRTEASQTCLWIHKETNNQHSTIHINHININHVKNSEISRKTNNNCQNSHILCEFWQLKAAEGQKELIYVTYYTSKVWFTSVCIFSSCPSGSKLQGQTGLSQ